MSETAGLIAAAPIGHPPDYSSSGKLVQGVEARVRPLDSDLLTDESDIAGIVCVRGRQLFGGYVGESKSGEDFLADGWLETGDIGRISGDGSVTISGRSKDIIIRSGNNIDPAVIEAATNLYPGVAESAAVAMPDRYAGEVPALYVVPHADQLLSVDTLIQHLRTHLADPHAHPARIIQIDKMPLTEVGKVSRVALRSKATKLALMKELEAQGTYIEFDVVHASDGTFLIRIPAGFAVEALENVASTLGLQARFAINGTV